MKINRLNRKLSEEHDLTESSLDDEIMQLILNYLLIDRVELLGKPEDEVQKSKETELLEAMKLISQNSNGRIVAVLPKVKDFLRLISPNLYTGGIRIKSIIRLLERDDFVSKAYADMFHNFVETGVLKKVDLDGLIKSGKKITELPHHGVIKLDSSTTPVRMVIAGDAKDQGRHSTNEIFMTGVNVLPLIFTILTHIRMEPQFILGDISKAFVQVELSEEDKNMLIIRWPVLQADGKYQHKFYAFERLPWGIKCAPSTLSCGRGTYRAGTGRIGNPDSSPRGPLSAVRPDLQNPEGLAGHNRETKFDRGQAACPFKKNREYSYHETTVNV